MSGLFDVDKFRRYLLYEVNQAERAAEKYIRAGDYPKVKDCRSKHKAYLSILREFNKRTEVKK